MKSNRQDNRRDLRDWLIITLIILIGFLCLIASGSMALRFPPSWKLSANMDSLLDPNSDFLTRRPQGFIEPVEQSILTPPAWMGLFQTPGATVVPQTPLPTFTSAPVSTATIPVVVTSNPTRTTIPTSTIIYIPASPTHTVPPPPPPTITNTPPVYVDLQITKDDGVVMYSGGSILTYTIVVTNSGPANVRDAIITDVFPPQLDNWEWTCTAQNGGAKGCNPTATNRANFTDVVSLPNGASIEYTVTAQVLLSASGDLVNTAQVAVPAAYTDSDPLNNFASDRDQFLPTSTLPVGNIGDTQDLSTDILAAGNSVTIRFSTPLQVNGHPGYDLSYYFADGVDITMDVVALEIGDGNNWYTIFYWGDHVADINSTMDFSVLGETSADNPETDNRDFSSSPPGFLYNGTGAAIELDGFVPPGTYPYLRIIAPPTAAYPAADDDLEGCEVDAIVILP